MHQEILLDQAPIGPRRNLGIGSALRRLFTTAALAALAALLLPAPARPQALEVVPEFTRFVHASDGGRVLIGLKRDTATYDLWADGELVELGLSRSITDYRLSGDGSVLTGVGPSNLVSPACPMSLAPCSFEMKWREDTTPRLLPVPDDFLNPFQAVATTAGVSTNGRTVIQTYRLKRTPTSDFEFNVLRWTDGVVELVSRAAGDTSELLLAQAFGASSNGQVLAGRTLSVLRRAVRFDGTAEDLGVMGQANAITPDGSVLVGQRVTGGGFVYGPFRWKDGIAESLGYASSEPRRGPLTEAIAVSRDGTMVLGREREEASTRLYSTLWIEGRGIRRLAEVLQTDFGLDLSAFDLSPTIANPFFADYMTPDGVFVGTGTLADTNQRAAWKVKLEDFPDVSVLASNTLRQEGEARIVTYDVVLTNLGDAAAENVKVEIEYDVPPSLSDASTVVTQSGRFPEQLHVLSTSPLCTGPPSNFVGGAFSCSGIQLAPAGDPFGKDVVDFAIEARITNAADLPPLTFVAEAPGDPQAANNRDRTTVNVGLDGGTIAQTREAMEIIQNFFPYRTSVRFAGCNTFRDDIYATFEQIHRDHPEVFDSLAYGPITSGGYTTGVGSTAGHVGLVVYPKGTDYHETGIIIHGLPSPSPISTNPNGFDTQVGTFPLGDAPPELFTSFSGVYFRTPVGFFPGQPRQEGAGCGFEGLYPDNGDEFRTTKRCVSPVAARNSEGGGCSIAPEAVMIETRSPVDLRIRNLRGEVVETLGDQVVVQEVDSGINSMAFPHGDGTFAWNLTLPPEDYIVELIGTGDGPYQLVMTRFAADAQRIDTIVDGVASPGVTEVFDFIDTVFASGFETEASPVPR